MESTNYWAKFARRPVTRRTVLRAAALGGSGLAAAALVGCGGAAKKSVPASGSAAPASAGGKAQPRKGGSAKGRVATDPPGWSVLDASGPVAQMNTFCYDGLTAVATGPGHRMGSDDLIPQLATAMPQRPDPLTYIYKIRQGVKFQNVAPVNGRPMTVEDVKYAIDTMRGKGSSHQATYEPVSSVDIPDKETVIVKTSRPYAPLLNTSSGQYLWKIFPKEIIDSNLTKSTAIGTGPFILKEWEQSKRIVYTRNPDYWDTKIPYLDEYQWLILPNTNSAVAAFQTGQIDLLGELSCTESADLAAQVKSTAKIQKSSRGATAFAAFNTLKPPFNDVRVRRAMSMAWNREATKQALFCGEWDAVSLFPSAKALSVDALPDLAANLKYDPKQAKDLLVAAGFANGFKTDVAWTERYNGQTGGIYSSELEMWASDLKQIGVTVNPVSYEYGKWIAEIYRPPFKWDGAMFGTQRVFYADPDSYAQYWYHPTGISNQSRVNDPAMTALVNKQQTQFDPKERWDTLHEIQKLDAKTSYYMWRPGGLENFFTQNRVHDYLLHKPDYQSSDTLG